MFLPRSNPCSPPIALPARLPHYVIPCSSSLDPPFSLRTATWPFPRFPRPFETETRADGTGLIWGGATINPCPPPPPCPPCPCPPSWWWCFPQRRWW